MNEKDIKALKWESDKRIGLGNGLYLNLRKSSKTFIVRIQHDGKSQIITIGKHPILSLKDARVKAMNLMLKEDISKVNVSQLKDKYWEEIVIPQSKVPNQVIGYLNNIENEFGRRKVIDITRAMLVRFIQSYSKNRGARSADRIRSYLKQLFNYAVELGYLDESPVLGVTKRITGYKNIERKRVLSDDEIHMIWSWKNNFQGWQKTEDNVRIIKFLLLTGLRISEAQKGYQDGDKFRIDDTKGKHSKEEQRPHWVYLTETAKSLLPLPTCTATNIQAWLKRKLVNEGIESRFTPHDCRRTFATMANENGVMPHIVEKCLNHKLEGMMSVYNHAEYENERIECAILIEKAIIKLLKSKTVSGG
jgi:integrase